MNAAVFMVVPLGIPGPWDGMRCHRESWRAWGAGHICQEAAQGDEVVTFRWMVSPGLSLWPLCRADLHSSLGPRTRLFQVAPTGGASPVLVSHGQMCP